MNTASDGETIVRWAPGTAPVAVVMISLNEAHNIAAALQNLSGWATEVFLVDSYSRDSTVDIALAHGVYVVQHCFQGFGDQWNFALRELPITAPYTMKLDPDERLSMELKDAIEKAIVSGEHDALHVTRRLWFMGQPLPVRQKLLRVWRTGACRFSDVKVNEQPIVEGRACSVTGDLEHHDSPTLEHWYDKQNRYSTAEAAALFRRDGLSAAPRIFGSSLERRMWLKQAYWFLPFRHAVMFMYCLVVQGAWRAGRVGVIWAWLRADVYRMIEYKYLEMSLHQAPYDPLPQALGAADPRALQATEKSRADLACDASVKRSTP